MPPLGTPLAGSKFNLNSAGVAGFFGGEEAIPAMAAVCLFRGGRWLGWYNSPGSYTIAKRFGTVANSRFWSGLFPGPRVSPTHLFGLDGMQGPKYIAALSGTLMETGHLGHLMMEWSEQIKAEEIPGRKTRPVYVAYLAMKRVDFVGPVERLPFKDALFAFIPIAASVISCIMCALVYDWFSFSMIFLGIISGGLASYVIGGGQLTTKGVINVAIGSPPGHGILINEGSVIVIKGDERDVNAITKGRFDLQMNLGHQEIDEGSDEEGRIGRSHHAVGFSCLLLLFQFLLQLLLVPQGSLFGQIMFLVSLVVSWAYNSYLSSLEKEKIQIRLLSRTLGNPCMRRFRVGTRTTMAVFLCLLLFHRVDVSSSEEERERRLRVLRSIIPINTAVWDRWREKVVNQLLHLDESASLSFLEEDEKDLGLSDSDRRLLRVLLGDAMSAIKGYYSVHESLPYDSSQKQS